LEDRRESPASPATGRRERPLPARSRPRLPTLVTSRDGQLACRPRQGAAEAKAMLLKVVAAVKADKVKALDMFNKGEGGFLDRDLYPFCANVSDGKFVAVYNPNARPSQVIGRFDMRTLKDSTGKAFGQEQFAAAQKPEGDLTEVNYLFPKP